MVGARMNYRELALELIASPHTAARIATSPRSIAPRPGVAARFAGERRIVVGDEGGLTPMAAGVAVWNVAGRYGSRLVREQKRLASLHRRPSHRHLPSRCAKRGASLPVATAAGCGRETFIQSDRAFVRRGRTG